MKMKVLSVALAVCFATVTASFGAESLMGTWKLNASKSKIARGTGRNSIVTYDWTPMFRTKVTIDGTDARGRKAHSEWIGHLDGDDYPVTGDPTSDARAYKKINGNTWDFSSKKNGKVVGHGRILVAADGKSRTVITISKNRRGHTVRSTAVYDKTGD